MRKVILAVAMSLDGKIEGPNGEFDWCFTDQDYGMSDFMKGIDTIFYGRKSYDMMLNLDPSDIPEGIEEFSDPFEKCEKYVFSNSLTQVNDGFLLISGNFQDKVKELKSLDGKDIWLFGGASLTTSFIKQDLLNEIWVAVHPLVLGPGKPLFVDLDNRLHLELFESKVYNTGLISLKYSVSTKANN